MRDRKRPGVWMGVYFLIGGAALAAPNERDFWQLWNLHATRTGEHAEVAKGCLLFAQQNAGDELSAVAQTLAAWHLLKLGRTEEAVKLLAVCRKANEEARALIAQSLGLA